MKKLLTIASMTFILFNTTTALSAGNGPAAEKVSRHWDSSNPGHAHECPICHQTYQAAGDLGPNSPGYERCPRCYPNGSTSLQGWTWTEGADGRRVYYPATGWTWTEGRDGRRVVYPSGGWTWTESRNGRRIAYPSSGWTWTEGANGCRVVYPSFGWTWTEGRDGRRVVYPSSGWTWTEGADGCRIVYPSSGWTWTEGRDGKRIVYPSSGWTWTEGRDGRRIAYPSSGWTWTEGADGRRVAYPSSGWTWTDRPNGRRIVYPSGVDPDNVYLPALIIEKLNLSPDFRRFSSFLLESMGAVDYSFSSASPAVAQLLLESLRLSNELQPYSALLFEQMGIVSSDGAARNESANVTRARKDLQSLIRGIKKFETLEGLKDTRNSANPAAITPAASTEISAPCRPLGLRDPWNNPYYADQAGKTVFSAGPDGKSPAINKSHDKNTARDDIKIGY